MGHPHFSNVVPKIFFGADPGDKNVRSYSVMQASANITNIENKQINGFDYTYK